MTDIPGKHGVYRRTLYERSPKSTEGHDNRETVDDRPTVTSESHFKLQMSREAS